jgi:3-hydroxyacyl-CoA dehydrogenase
LLEGATPAEVDGALEDFGMAMGILAVYDLAGTDVGHLTRAERKHLLPDDPTFYRASALLNERGWLGQKTGRGCDRYVGGERIADAEAIEMFRAEARRLGVPQRRPSQEEIVERCIYALINEGARVLEEGVAMRASDVDVVYTSGYGFPRYRGGPMFYADGVGLRHIYERIVEFRATLDPRYWQPAPLLERLAREQSTFAQWQRQKTDATER